VSDGRSTVILQPGHCVELSDGSWAQLIVAVLSISGDVSIVLWPFTRVRYSPAGGRHPEASLPWLKRASRYVLHPVALVKRRAHIVRLNGNVGRRANDREPHFLANPGVFFRQDDVSATRSVFSSCPVPNCHGRAPKPSELGDTAQCGVCDHEFPWY